MHNEFKYIKQMHVLQKLFFTALLFVLMGCAGGYYAEEDYLTDTPYEDSPYEKAYLDEHSGNDENLGPNAPGFIGPDGEFSMYPDSDPH